MKTTLYVFTGTGNSLAAAEFLADRLKDTVIESIPLLMKRSESITPEEGRVGFIFPVNYCGTPVIIRDFVPRLDLSEISYLFTVCTSGGIGRYAVLQFGHLLQSRKARLNAGWIIKMVDNYIPYGGAPDAQEQKKDLAVAEELLTHIADSILNERSELPRLPALSWVLNKVIYPRFIRSLPTIDERFNVDESCNACGICSRVCPSDNIRIESNKPVWKHKCLFCLACMNICPKEAIQLEEKCRERRRYHHPGITVKRLIQFQRGGEE